MCCIEITGPEGILFENLKKCANIQNGLTFVSKCYTEGLREGNITMFHPENLKPIGNVSITWKPRTDQNQRVIWIWTHPTYFQEVVDCFKVLFNLKSDGNLFKSDKIVLKNLKDCLNRYRLIGPLASCILGDSLKTTSTLTLAPDDSIMEVDTSIMEVDIVQENLSEKVETVRRAVGEYYNQRGWIEELKKQNELLEELRNIEAAHFGGNVVLGGLVKDPRFYMPSIRTKSITTLTGKRLKDLSAGLV